MHSSQQKILDDIVKKHLDILDVIYKEPPKKGSKKTAQNKKTPKKPKELKKPNYKQGKCSFPGCDAMFEKKSGVQRHCPEHKHKYVPVAERKN
jgi:hypothetical protein